MKRDTRSLAFVESLLRRIRATVARARDAAYEGSVQPGHWRPTNLKSGPPVAA